VAHKRLFNETEYESCEKTRLRGIVGNSVEAELANVVIQMNDNRDCYVQVLRTICDCLDAFQWLNVGKVNAILKDDCFFMLENYLVNLLKI